MVVSLCYSISIVVLVVFFKKTLTVRNIYGHLHKFLLKSKKYGTITPIILMGEYTSPHKVKNSKQAVCLVCSHILFIQSSQHSCEVGFIIH